jgi:hypothetical protein
MLQRQARPGTPQAEFEAEQRRQQMFAAPRSMMSVPPRQIPRTPGPQVGERWNLEYTMFGKPLRFPHLDDAGLVAKLESFYMCLLDDLKLGEQAQRARGRTTSEAPGADAWRRQPPRSPVDPTFRRSTNG